MEASRTTLSQHPVASVVHVSPFSVFPLIYIVRNLLISSALSSILCVGFHCLSFPFPALSFFLVSP